jgi:hypothetical protein
MLIDFPLINILILVWVTVSLITHRKKHHSKKSILLCRSVKFIIKYQDGSEDAVVEWHQEVHLDVDEPAGHCRLDPGHPALQNHNQRS